MSSIERNNVAVIITTYNEYEKTAICLEHVYAQSDMPRRIVVVDNGSDNEIIDKLLNLWKALTQKYTLENPVEVYSDDVSYAPAVLLRRTENEGYAVAVNHALRMLLYDKESKAYWILHNDTFPEKYALSALMRHTVEEKNNVETEYHIVGSTILRKDLDLLQCAGGGKFSFFTGKVRLYDENISRLSLSDREDALKKINFIYGASMLVRREALETVGLFNEKFFLFFEDVEFCLRAQKAGLRINWAPGAVVSHVGPTPGRPAPVRSFNQLPINDVELPQLADYYNIRNRFALLKQLNPHSYYLAMFTLPLPLSIRWFKGEKSRFNNVINAAKDGIKS